MDGRRRITRPRAALVALAAVLIVACDDAGASGGTKGPLAAPTGTAAASGTPVRPTPVADSALRPAQILDLTNWKLQLPVNAAGAFTGAVAEISQPALAAYAQDPYFVVRGDAVRFRAPVNGVTTSGSSYPRSELREMTDSGTRQASWSTTSGTHTMVLEEAVIALPQSKPHVVAAQIHDAKDDVITVRLENARLFVDHNGKAGATLTTTYALGTRFTVKIEAAGGEIKVYYNGSPTPADTLPLDGGGNYFKAGVYTQSNCTRERTCSADNFGEVAIYRVTLSHQ